MTPFTALVVGITLYLQVFWDGVPLPCLADTGATVSIVSTTNAARLGTLGPPLGTILLRTITGEIVSGERRYIPNVGIKDQFGWSGGEIVVLADKLFPWGCVLGTDFLGQQPIEIDWAQGTLRARRGG